MGYKKSISSFLKITGTATSRWWAKDPFMQSAVIAYYAIFSIPGLLIIVISISSVFFKQDIITGNLIAQISSIMGAETGRQINDMIISLASTEKSFFATLLGILAVLLGATGVFVELQKALNVIWEVKPKPRKAIFEMLRTRLFSFGLILSIGFLLLISLTITTVISIMSNWVTTHLPKFMLITFYMLNFLISFGVVMFLFALLFKILPDVKIKWKHIWLGSVITAILFVLGKTAIGFYLSKTNPGSLYGAAGSLVLILLWVSYSSMIFFFGAEITRASADNFNGNIAVRDIAININKK